ncbi:class II glutamine amidotransferase [Svornostia abyssi]|uniref:Class II glutamine amidotransferase n=1 Tax=Svornostia abyssi TaxID=2898438 RepID=A0ABY5PDG4_9ACTN|nr:class II glutamine amidotransferase [Parviterribacteraceae bacterium J379]
MCRWNAYFGQPILVSELLYRTQHGLVAQARQANEGIELLNGDGFGIGWYDDFGEAAVHPPGRYRSVQPAWNDVNLRELAAHLRSPLFLAHVRMTTGTPVQQTNCHPFRHEQWLFVQNGEIVGYPEIRRDLLLGVDRTLFGEIEGTTDSELMFFLALSFGLQDDPLGGLARAVGFIEATGRAAGIDDPVEMTVGMSDGDRLWAVRYGSGARSRTLYESNDADTIRSLYPDIERFQGLQDEDRIVVSEPLGDLPGLWREVPEGTAVVIQPGEDAHVPFAALSP